LASIRKWQVHIYNNIPEGPSSQDSLMGGQAGSANLYLDCNNYVGGDKNGIIWKTKYTSTNTSNDYTKKSAGIYYQPEGNYFKGGLGFYTNNSESTYGDHVERMRIDMDGNVGIGNAGPDCKLHVVTNSARAAKFKSNYNAGIGGGAYIEVNNNAGTRCILGSDGNGLFNSSTTALILGNWSGGDLKFISTGGGAAGEILTLKSNGNVGIGNTSPKNKLDITTNYTGDYTSAININSSFRDSGEGEYQCGMGAIPGNRGFFSTSSSYVLGTHILSTAEWGIYSSGWDKLFGIDGGSGNAYIKGNVGIGTSPSAKLHVNGSTLLGDTRPTNVTHLDALLTLAGAHNSGYNTNNKIKLLITGGNNDSGSPYDILCEDENSYDYFHLKGPDNGNDSAASLYIKGNVGIGTLPSAWHKLNVNGAVTINEHLEVNSSVLCMGNLTVLGTISGVNNKGQNADGYANFSSSYKAISSSTWHRILKSAGGARRVTFKCTIIELSSGRHSATTFLYSHHYGTTPSFTLLNRTAYNQDSVPMIRYWDYGTYDETGIDLFLYSGSRVRVFIDQNYQDDGIQIVDFEENPSIGGKTVWEVSLRNYSFAVINQNPSLFSNRVGIGLSPSVAPSYFLHVARGSTSISNERYLSESGPYNSTNLKTGSNSTMSMRSEGGIVADNIFFLSDRRIKKNIIIQQDDDSIYRLRNIECYWYNYKDTVEKGNDTVLGFIAQQVNEYMPEAIEYEKTIIPNEYRRLYDISWSPLIFDSSNNHVSEDTNDVTGSLHVETEKYKLTIHDLSDNSGNQLYRFFVSNDLSGNDEKKLEIKSLENDPKSFLFDQSWNYVFLYGKEVNDLHVLDKNKLYALNFSATQEIDRIQQQQIVDISENKFDISENKFKITDSVAKIASLEAQVTSQQEIITTLQNELSSLKQTVQQLIDNAST
jgi:hypothetical protein